MKKLLGLLFSVLLVMSLLAGCGGGSEKTGNEDEVKEEQKEALENGYWVAEKMVMEGTEFSGSDMTDIFGSKDSIVSLAFTADGAVNGIFFEENIKGTYTGTLEKFEVDVAGEKMTGAYTEDKMLELKLEDGSAFYLANQKEIPDAIKNNPWVTYKLDFTAEDTMKMSNFMSYGRYWVEDGVIYGLTHAASNSGNLGATPFSMKGDFPQFEEPKILDGQGLASYVNKEGDYIYYLRDLEAICRVKTDGSDLEVLYEGACDYFQIHNGRLYFTDADYHFVSTDMDGKDLQTVVDKEIYYPYFICEDWMVFQDDADDESIHLYNTTHGEELNVTYFPTYCPVLDGKYLYYTANTDGGYYLSRIDMSDPDTFYCEMSEELLFSTEVFIDEESIYTSNDKEEPKENWQKLADDEPAWDVVKVCLFEGYTIYHEWDSQGLITAKYLMNKETNGGTSFK